MLRYLNKFWIWWLIMFLRISPRKSIPDFESVLVQKEKQINLKSFSGGGNTFLVLFQIMNVTHPASERQEGTQFPLWSQTQWLTWSHPELPQAEVSRRSQPWECQAQDPFSLTHWWILAMSRSQSIWLSGSSILTHNYSPLCGQYVQFIWNLKFEI